MPLDMTMAVLASKAWMPRKSSFSAPGGMAQSCQTVAAVFGAEDGAVGSAGPGDSAADAVDAAQAGGGVGVFDLPLGFGLDGQGEDENNDGQAHERHGNRWIGCCVDGFRLCAAPVSPPLYLKS